jgi:hypothetical protein
MPRIQLRRATAAEWAAANPILAAGEPGVETDTGHLKFGNGSTPWNGRPYQVGPVGDDAYEVAVAGGFVGDRTAWLASLVGPVGDDAYEVAVAGGFVGDRGAWLASLVGPEGDPGPQGDGLHIDDTVATYAALPASPAVGYSVAVGSMLYVYGTGGWPAEGLGVNLGATTAWSLLTGVPATVTNIDAILATKEDTSARGAANGYAPLNASGHVPTENLPAYVDDVVEYASFAALPGTGVAGKLYVTTDTNLVYRWSGSGYLEVSKSIQPHDLQLMAFGAKTTRAAGTGDNPFGYSARRAFTIDEVRYRCATSDASGNVVVELRRNGSAIPGSSATIAAANQVAGTTVTFGPVAVAKDDILTVSVSSVGTTPGKGLVADIRGTA